ncbi:MULTISPECIES: amidase family protein [Microbacteriaceae]|nr:MULTISPECIES: amidase family protein [Microbacteriaceae]QZY51285.1 hypothetical protein KVY00_11910 [Leucobacter tenebrionis]
MPLTIGLLLEAPGGTAVDDDYVQATSDAAEVLSAIGHRVVRVRPTEEVRRVGSVFGAIAGAHLARLLSDGEDLDPDVLEPVTAEVVRAGRSMTAVELLRVLTELHALSYAFADHFSGVDVVLSPTTAQPPPLIGTMSTDRPAAVHFAELFSVSPFAGIFNVTGGAALSVPWGLDQRGLPVGIHLGAAIGDDELILTLGEQLENARPDLTRLHPPDACGPGNGRLQTTQDRPADRAGK